MIALCAQLGSDYPRQSRNLQQAVMPEHVQWSVGMPSVQATSEPSELPDPGVGPGILAFGEVSRRYPD